jgi:CubicO group peptidase (beta-lactamase class C family)
VPEPQDILPKTLQTLERGMAEGLHIGAQVYVSLNGEPVADFAIGEARAGVPMKTDTLMVWLSCSKPVGAVAIGQLWEQKRLDFDDRVERFIPEFGVKGKGPITLRHLLTHTAGFQQVQTGWPDASWGDILAAVCAAPMERGWVPGKKAGYHLSSWFLLGEVVRRVDGRPYERYVREDIFEPLGMLDSWVGMPEAQYSVYGDRRGIMHGTLSGTARPVPVELNEAGWTRCHPGAGAHGPLRELGRFYEMLLAKGQGNTGTVLTPQTVETLTERHRIGLRDHTFQQVIDWGLGFIVNSNRYGSDPPYNFGPYASPDTYGHGGSQSSISFADPERGLVVAWVCNGMPGESRHASRNTALNAAIYEDLGWP